MFHGLGQPHQQGYGMNNLRFPGSQPVSLDRYALLQSYIMINCNLFVYDIIGNKMN